MELSDTPDHNQHSTGNTLEDIPQDVSELLFDHSHLIFILVWQEYHTYLSLSQVVWRMAFATNSVLYFVPYLDYKQHMFCWLSFQLEIAMVLFSFFLFMLQFLIIGLYLLLTCKA